MIIDEDAQELMDRLDETESVYFELDEDDEEYNDDQEEGSEDEEIKEN